MDEAARVALVSGANRGIGREIARQLAARGLTVVVGARRREAAEEAAEELRREGGQAIPAQLDVTDARSVEALVGGLERLDVLVNNAGVIGDGGSAVEPDLDGVRATLETNLFGPWSLARAAIPRMREHGYGRIASVSSGMGQLSDMGGGAPAYRVSKTALNAMTRMLAAELRGENILVNVACPGWAQTDMGGPSASRTVQQGADTPVWLATLPDDGPRGGFFRDRQPIPW